MMMMMMMTVMAMMTSTCLAHIFVAVASTWRLGEIIVAQESRRTRQLRLLLPFLSLII